jgi:hypothetical protein
VTVDRDAVAEPEEETARRSVWEERCRVGRVRCGWLGDRTGMEENNLRRTDVVPAKRSTALRMCMECSVSFVPVRTQARRGANQINQIPQDRIMDTRRFGIQSNIGSTVNPNLLVPLSS